MTSVTQLSANSCLDINKIIAEDLLSCHRVYNYLYPGYNSDPDYTNTPTQFPNLI